MNYTITIQVMAAPDLDGELLDAVQDNLQSLLDDVGSDLDRKIYADEDSGEHVTVEECES